MNINEAYHVISKQRGSFKRLNDMRLEYRNFEYRLRYVGGLSEFFCIDRREIGKRNFKYFHGFSAWRMPDNEAVARYLYNLFSRGGHTCTVPRTR